MGTMSRRFLPAVLALALLALASGAAVPARAQELTGAQFLSQCDHIQQNCRDEFSAGLMAVTEGKMACPPRIDENAPISDWIIAMHRLVDDRPDLAGKDASLLQLSAFKALWPCAKK